MKNKHSVPRGHLILLSICGGMIIITALQLLLASDLGGAQFVRSNLINILLGAGGMGALLYLGNGVLKKLNSLEELVRPLEKKDYSALASLQPGESYRELGKSIKDMGTFIEMFKNHTKGNAEIEAVLAEIAKNVKAQMQEASINEPLTGNFKEIESQAEQAASALQQVESCFSSINELGEFQSQTIRELQDRLSATAELEYSLAATLEENGKNAGALRTRINEGEEQSRNAFNSIKDTAINLEEITDIVKAINQTSQQTNILSMNAAIESAHAGAAGAGFAVVADEIRKLAESTRVNAKNIQAVLLAISRQITEASKASEISSLAFSNLTAEITSLATGLETVAEDARNQTTSRVEIKTALTESSGETKKIRDGTVDIAAFISSFKAAIENIQGLCDPAKIAAAKTMPGTRQSPKNLEASMEKVLEYLKEAEELGGMISPRALVGDSLNTAAEGTLASLAKDYPALNYSPDAAKSYAPKDTHSTAAFGSTQPSAGVGMTGYTQATSPAAAPAPFGRGQSSVGGATVGYTPVAKAHGAAQGGDTIKPPEGVIAVAKDITEDNSHRRDVTVKTPPRTVY